MRVHENASPRRFRRNHFAQSPPELVEPGNGAAHALPESCKALHERSGLASSKTLAKVPGATSPSTVTEIDVYTRAQVGRCGSA